MSANYFDHLRNCLEDIDMKIFNLIVELMWISVKQGGRVWIAGNGGSGSTASHFAIDLSKADIKAISFVDNPGLLTAWANDVDFAEVFAGQVDLHVEGGDVLVVISASGKSSNICRAAQIGKDKAANVIGLLGFNGGLAKELCDLALIVCSKNYGRIEDAHLAICHAITQELRKRVKRMERDK